MFRKATGGILTAERSLRLTVRDGMKSQYRTSPAYHSQRSVPGRRRTARYRCGVSLHRHRRPPPATADRWPPL